ncbi:MAG TPA: sigma-70 family RNA polymerase sigma factor [Tepidisphaeraceae bacterium]|jgi:RNA polymerase sigma-70 factor (ECF subfamily)|nr:sigma-70 family RNA polymerase sigma factor [Tepidisphaeraceae bacterium]
MSSALLTSRFTPAPDDPGDLATRVAGGDRGAFDELVRLYSIRVARLAHRLLGWEGDIDDVVQDVFVAALQNATKFKGNSSIWTWLTVITVNRCRSHHRHKKVIRRVMGILFQRRGEHANPADHISLGDENARQVRLAVAGLKPILREAVVLFYLEHKSIDEISRLVGASPAAVEVRLYRAREKLRSSLSSFEMG